jgi:hypothetical protein
MTTQTIRNGASIRLNVLPGQSVAVVAVSGTYNASIVQGAGLGVIATAATGGTYGPYASGIVILLTSSASSEIDFDVAVTPVIVSDTLVTASTDPITGVVKGLVDTKGGGYLLGTNGFVPATDDYAGIMAAYNAAMAQGGGTIHFKPVTYNIGANTIPLNFNIHYKGSGWQPYFPHQIVDDSYVTPQGGTIIQGDGTAIGFNWRGDDRSEIPIAPEAPDGIYNRLSLTGCSIEDLSISNCSFGIKIGARYNLGAAYCHFNNIATFNCTEWGQWYENCIHVVWGELVDIGSGASAAWNKDGGGISFAFSINGYNNADISRVLVSAPANLLTKVVQFIARDPLGIAGNMTGGITNGGFLQGVKFNYTPFVNQTVGVTNGLSEITVTDYTKFAIDLPVLFTSDINSFKAGKVYTVKTITPGSGTAGSITLAHSPREAAIVSNQTTTATITHKGFAPISAIAQGPSCIIGLGEWQMMDSEGTGTAMLYANHLFGNITIPPAFGGSTLDICIRASSVIIKSKYGNNQILDLDTTSATRSMLIGNSAVPMGANARIPVARLIHADATQEGNVASMNINLYSRGPSFTAQLPSPYAADWLRPGAALGVSQGYSTSTALAASLSNGVQGWGVYTGSGAGTWTFTGGLNSRMAGYKQTFKNQGTGALTITLSATDGTFDGMTGGTSSGKSFSLAAPTTTALGGCLTMVCAQIGASTYQWEVESLLNATLV